MPRKKQKEDDPTSLEGLLAQQKQYELEDEVQKLVPKSILDFKADPELKTRGAWTVTLATKTMSAVDWMAKRLKLKRGQVIDWAFKDIVQEYEAERAREIMAAKKTTVLLRSGGRGDGE